MVAEDGRWDDDNDDHDVNSDDQVDSGGSGQLWHRVCQDWQCRGLCPCNKLSLMDQLQRGGKIRDMT